jgi:hypothetical protein
MKIRKAEPPAQLTPQYDHVMPQHDILRLKPGISI